MCIAGREPRRELAQQLAQFPFEVPDTGLARVVGDDRSQDLVAELHLIRPQTVLPELTREQMVATDCHLLVFRVAVETDHFETVE